MRNFFPYGCFFLLALTALVAGCKPGASEVCLDETARALAQATAWSARAVSEAGNVPVTIW